MTDPISRSIDYNRSYFALLEEFFVRATGKGAEAFELGTLVDTLKGDAHNFARRAQDAYPWLDSEFRQFVANRGNEAFEDATKLGGTNLVLGGSSRFHRSQLNSTLATVLYGDTVFVPDPIMPWLERDRPEERFRDVEVLRTAHALLHLKPLVDADLPVPPIVVFPSWEKLLEDNDAQTQTGISHLVADIVSHGLGESLASLEDVLAYSVKNLERLLEAVDRNHLFVAPGGPVGEPLRDALARYDQEMARWRSSEWLANYRRLPQGVQVVNGITERLTPIYHLLENAEELRGNPLICLEQHAHYFHTVVGTSNARLRALDVLDPKTIALVNSLGSQRLKWLGTIPIDALVNLRRDNANADFRELLRGSAARLSASNLTDVDHVAAEVCHDLQVAIAKHEGELRKVQEKYNSVHGQTLVLEGLAGLGVVLLPALAPLLGTAVPLAIAAKYARDKIAEISEKRQHTKSLVGVLAVSRPD